MSPSIIAKKAELDRLRPLSGRSLAALAAWYDVELTYSSNAIEGSTLTRSETAVVLEHGITIGGKPLKDHLAALDHNDALRYVRALAERAEKLRETDIRELHRLVTLRADPHEAGQYSNHQRQIVGSAVVLPSPAEIVPLMGDFGRWLALAALTPDTAFIAHERLVTIHPLSDGNGRNARLLMNLVLLKAGYPPAVIGPEHRVGYIEGLQALQLAGDPAPYHQFMAGRLEASLDHHLAMLARGLDHAASAPQS